MRCKPALSLVVTLCLTIGLAGCGSSGNSTPSGPLQITTTSQLPSGRVNTAYITTFIATGGTPPYSWSASSAPPGLVMSTAGALSGTPTSPCSPCTLAVAVSDSLRGNASGSFTITIASPLQITTTSLPNSAQNAFYQQTLAATGGFSPYTWSITQGNLPVGLTLNATSGLISGTPTIPGTSNFTVQVSDNGSPSLAVTANLSLIINTPPGRNAALYDTFGYGRQIGTNGSLTLLPSSPEPGGGSAISPTLPLIFGVTTLGSGQQPPEAVEALLINADYALSRYSTSAALPSTNDYGPVSVDPTGSDLYLPGYIDDGQVTGLLIYSADGAFTPVGNIAIPAVNCADSVYSRRQLRICCDLSAFWSGKHPLILTHGRWHANSGWHDHIARVSRRSHAGSFA